jgi:hypothetical protein
MPIDYKDYPANWKTEIRPAILTRAFNCCEFCNIKNGIIVLRGRYKDIEVYQDDDGNIYDAFDSERIGANYVGDIDDFGTFVKIVLTIAHLDHNTEHNDYSNLKALCQRCHNRYDRGNRNKNIKEKKLKIQPQLF